MSKENEFIIHEPLDEDAWVCTCGNAPHEDGFYPCDQGGDEIEPRVESGWIGLYVCRKCGRIVDQTTLQVVGQNPIPQFLD